MPHFTLEHTSNLPTQIADRALFRRLHGILAEVVGVDVANCKSRALSLDRFQEGVQGDGGAFVHLDVRLLAGRSPEELREAGRRLVDALGEAYSGVDRPIQITVELQDMARDRYFKRVHGLPPPEG